MKKVRRLALITGLTIGTRWLTYPVETADGTWALDVTDYDLDDSEKHQLLILTSLYLNLIHLNLTRTNDYGYDA